MCVWRSRRRSPLRDQDRDAGQDGTDRSEAQDSAGDYKSVGLGAHRHHHQDGGQQQQGDRREAQACPCEHHTPVLTHQVQEPRKGATPPLYFSPAASALFGIERLLPLVRISSKPGSTAVIVGGSARLGGVEPF